MKKITLSLFILSFFILPEINAQNLDEVLNKYYQAINQEKLSGVQTVTIKAKIQQAGMEIPMQISQKRPGKVRTEGTFQGMTFISAYDGEGGWSINPFAGSTEVQPMTEEQVDQTKDQADIDGFLYNYEQKGYKLELLPEEEIDGVKVYVVNVTKPNNDVIVHYIDSESFVVLKTKSKIKMQGVDSEVESFMSNYKPVEEVLLPFSIENKMNGQTVVQILIDEIEFNKEMSDSLFSMPEKETK